MSFERLYRASMYLTLFLATLLLSIDATSDNRFALLFPLGVAAAGLAAFVTVDRDPRRGLPRDLANFLAAVAFILAGMEWYNDESGNVLLAIGHVLIYLQIIKYFLPKTIEDDWFLFLIGLVEAVIGVYVSQSDEAGILLILWVLASLWTLGLFFLRRESLRDAPPPEVSILPSMDRDDPYPGLINPAFVLATLRVAATTMLLGLVIFLLMPRWTVKGQNRRGQIPTAKHLTGFSDSVTLGQMGEILENDSIVMTVELTDADNHVITPPPDLLLRGVTLTEYSRNRLGKWQWTRQKVNTLPIAALNVTAPEGVPEIRQRIKLEPTDSDILFAIRPILSARASSTIELAMNSMDGTIYRRDLREFDEASPPRTGKFDYTVSSGTLGPPVQNREQYPGETALEQEFLHIPVQIEPQLRAIVDPIIARLPAADRRSPLARAKALESYLRDGEFTYSLRMSVVDPNLDPVLDFLINRKQGHCEYFASALTLMCRAAGIPARMVNGFKGGDWNDLGRVLYVREKHAHSWVEALVGRMKVSPVWETLDPTPSRARDESVAQVGGSVRYRYLTDFIRYQWTFNVVGFDADRQERKIYGPIRYLAGLAMLGFGLMGQMLRDAMKWFYFENPAQFFSVRGFFVSFAAMLLLVGLFRLGRWLFYRLLGLSRDRDGAADSRDPSLAFYYRLLRILASLGLERPSAETPREFARRAALVLEHRDEMKRGLSAVPGLVVEAFYSKRFGQRELSPEQIRELESRLELLESGLASGNSKA